MLVALKEERDPLPGRLAVGADEVVAAVLPVLGVLHAAGIAGVVEPSASALRGMCLPFVASSVFGHRMKVGDRLVSSVRRRA